MQPTSARDCPRSCICMIFSGGEHAHARTGIMMIPLHRNSPHKPLWFWNIITTNCKALYFRPSWSRPKRMRVFGSSFVDGVPESELMRGRKQTKEDSKLERKCWRTTTKNTYYPFSVSSFRQWYKRADTIKLVPAISFPWECKTVTSSTFLCVLERCYAPVNVRTKYTTWWKIVCTALVYVHVRTMQRSTLSVCCATSALGHDAGAHISFDVLSLCFFYIFLDAYICILLPFKDLGNFPMPAVTATDSCNCNVLL